MYNLYEVRKMNERDLWDEAYEWALERANEEGDVDIDYDEELISAWAKEHYDYLKRAKEHA